MAAAAFVAFAGPLDLLIRRRFAAADRSSPHYEYDGNGSLTCVSTSSGCGGTVGRQVTMTSFNMAAGVIQGNTALSLVYDDQHSRVTQISTDTGANTSTETTYINDAGSGAMSIQTVTGTVVPTKWDFFHWDSDPWGGTLPTGTPIFTDYVTLDGQIMAQRVSANPVDAAWDLGSWDTTLHWDGIITATKWDFFNWSSSPPAAGTPWTGTTSAGVWDSFTWDAAPWGGPATISYFVLDHLGSVAVVTNESGEVIQRLSYDPWGKQRNPNGSDVACGTITSPTTRGYTNQEELPAQCLVNLNARLYDPSIGRFLAADPVVGDPMAPNAFNRYAYVLNNPLSFTDPTGNDPDITPEDFRFKYDPDNNPDVFGQQDYQGALIASINANVNNFEAVALPLIAGYESSAAGVMLSNSSSVTTQFLMQNNSITNASSDAADTNAGIFSKLGATDSANIAKQNQSIETVYVTAPRAVQNIVTPQVSTGWAPDFSLGNGLQIASNAQNIQSSSMMTVRLAFSNIGGLGDACGAGGKLGPQCVHTEIEIYQNGQKIFTANGEPGLQLLAGGNIPLVMDMNPADWSSVIPELTIVAPGDMDPNTFARNIISEAQAYMNNLIYSVPSLYGGDWYSGTYNSNSLAAGILNLAGHSSKFGQIIEDWVGGFGKTAPGTSSPVPPENLMRNGVN